MILITCWVALAATALVNVGGAAIGAAYHPSRSVIYFAAALVPVVIAATVLLVLPKAKGGMKIVALIVAAIAGLGLAGFYGTLLLSDAGDAMLWLPPVILGVGLLALAFDVVGHRAEDIG